MSVPLSFAVSTQGISPDVRHANGDFAEIGRGPLDASQLMGLLSLAQHLASPAPDREDVCIPQVQVHGPAGRFVFFCDGGHLFSYEVDAALNPAEAMAYVTGQRPLPSAAPPPPPPAGGATFARGFLGLLVSGVILLVGVAGGVGIVRNSDEQIIQIAGIFLMVITVSFAAGIFRAIRGRTAKQARAEHAEHAARQGAIRAEEAAMPPPAAAYTPPMQAPPMQAPPAHTPPVQAPIAVPVTQAPAPTTLALAFDSGTLSGQVVAIPDLPVVRIGRAADNEIRFDMNQDVAVSGHHAQIRHESDGQRYLHDVGSSGGTYVDGVRITALVLRPGQTLVFGNNGPIARVIIPAMPKTHIGG